MARYDIRVHASLLAGYAAAILTLGTISTIGSASAFNPHEFSTAAEAFWFGMFVWGVLVVAGGGLVFGLLSLPVGFTRMRFAPAFTAGIASGLLVFLIAGFGLAKRIARTLGIGARFDFLVPGVVAGLLVLIVFVLVSAGRGLTPRNLQVRRQLKRGRP